MICMVLIKKRRLRPDIWSKTPQQAKSIKSMMRGAWNTKAMRRQNVGRRLNSLFSSTGKETRYIDALLIRDWCH